MWFLQPKPNGFNHKTVRKFITEKKKENLYIAGIVLTVVGALNWGLVGLFKFDLVAAVTGSKFGEVNAVSRIVYVLVLVAGVVAAASIPEIA